MQAYRLWLLCTVAYAHTKSRDGRGQLNENFLVNLLENEYNITINLLIYSAV